MRQQSRLAVRLDHRLNLGGHPDDARDQRINHLVPVPRPGARKEASAQIPGHATTITTLTRGVILRKEDCLRRR